MPEHDTGGALHAAARSMRARYAVLDFVRLMAVFMMIQGHAIGTYVIPEDIPTQGLLGNIYIWLRGLTSPTFLLVSGMVNFLGLKRDDKGRVLPHVLRKRIKRALVLVLIDYLLIFPGIRVWDLFVLDAAGWHGFFRVGTLNIIGVSLLFVVLAMRFTRSDGSFMTVSLLIGGAIAVATPWVHNVDWFEHLPPIFAHYLTYKGGSYFSIFPHTGFMFVGAALGSYALSLLKEGNPWRFTQRTVEIGIAITILALSAGFYGRNLFPPHNMFVSSPFMFCEKVGLALVLVGLYSVLFNVLRRHELYFSRLSKKTLHIYSAHVLIVFGNAWVWSVSRIWKHSLPLWQGALLAIAMIALSFAVGAVMAHAERNKPETLRALRFGFTTVLTYLLIFGT